MTDIIYEKLNIIWNMIKDDYLFMSLGGSRVLSFIHNPDDYDILLTYSSSEKGKKTLHTLHKNNDLKSLVQELKEKYNVNIITRSMLRLDEIHHWSYQEPNFLFGSSDDYKVFKVLDYKNEYMEIIRQGIINTRKRYNEQKMISKSLYRSLIPYYYILNNSYDLTEEQIDNINLAHDAAHNSELIEQALQLLDWLDVEVNNLKESEVQ